MTEADDGWPPPGIDISVPSTARVYDAILGGKDNFKADREAAEVFVGHVPQAKECAQENRRALIRGVQYLVRMAGIDQILDIGCGLPTKQNTHEAAQEINPDTRVVYVDNDPMVLSHGRALLATDDSTRIVTADLRDPELILAHPDVRSFLDFDRPVALMVVGMIMQISEHENPNQILADLMEPLPSGSHLFLTAWPDTGDAAQRSLSRACLETLGNGWIRSLEQLEAHFLGMEMVSPGLEYVARWFPEEPDKPVPTFEELQPFERTQMAGIAKKA
ncbi:SAM-dependent methyltransferase [Glycomyces sp. L485]|uniref:SAM-dependent methyltransferase n=1 Tax=Glycomyces sp. L485 TaxID=2909235 RepID=UPI001F4AA154|nr:SAM-dependent methyltransferase [Glycomyces sp. L485]MCH7233095.1 SAM-dependent methyltransferase [Glycomyces sp. L485]